MFWLTAESKTCWNILSYSLQLALCHYKNVSWWALYFITGAESLIYILVHAQYTTRSPQFWLATNAHGVCMESRGIQINMIKMLSITGNKDTVNLVMFMVRFKYLIASESIWNVQNRVREKGGPWQRVGPWQNNDNSFYCISFVSSYASFSMPRSAVLVVDQTWPFTSL